MSWDDEYIAKKSSWDKKRPWDNDSSWSKENKTSEQIFENASKELLEKLQSEHMKQSIQEMIVSDTALMQIKSLEVKDIVLVILTKPVQMTSVQKMVDVIKTYPKIYLKKDVSICIIPDGMSLSSLSEEEMNAAGWFRKKDCRRYLRPEV